MGFSAGVAIPYFLAACRVAFCFAFKLVPMAAVAGMAAQNMHIPFSP